MNEPKVIKEKDRDSWYKRMGERKTIHPNDYPFVGLIEWVDLMVEFR